MSKKTISMLVGGGLIAFLLIVVVMMGVGYKNQEISLRNQAVAQQKANEATYDKVWKVIKQKANITDKYASDFKDIFGGLMASRYQGEANGAPAFKWIQERNPNFSVDMYKDLSQAIESNRSEFLRVQKRLIDIKREHDNLRLQIPSSFFVGSKPELDIKVVTSTKTEATFESQKEDDVDLF